MNYWKPYGNIREEKGSREGACITFSVFFLKLLYSDYENWFKYDLNEEKIMI